MASATPLKERYRAGMVLSGVGDALAYKNGEWEFARRGEVIYEELLRLGGLSKVVLDPKHFMVSDDTVMQIATAEGLVSAWQETPNPFQQLFLNVAGKYKGCMSDMAGRAPGNTCRAGCSKLKPSTPNGYIIPFNPRGGGAGAAMRALPIGIFFASPNQLEDLTQVAIECGRMTHNNPIGFLGSFASALFMSFAIQGKPLREWGAELMKSVDTKALTYVRRVGRDVKEEEFTKSWQLFTDKWNLYLEERGIADGHSDPVFPEKFGFAERDAFYKKLSINKWGGSCGHDAPMIAYDALLGARNSWEELCYRAMIHGGDSDTTGILAGGLWGAIHGFQDVPSNLYEKLEYRDRLTKLADTILAKQK